MTLLRLICLTVCLGTSVSVQANSYPYQRCFEAAASLHQVPVDLLLAVAATESNWQPDARSHANAHGIMQIQWPGTARHLGVKRVAELYNPCLNINLGAQYLAELDTAFKQNTDRALAAYNYGPTRIKRSTSLPEGAQRYVDKVRAHQKKIVAGARPEGLQLAQRWSVVTFDSSTRAQRIARHLDDKLTGATASVKRTKIGYQHEVVLTVGSDGLSMSDHLLLTALGLTP